MLEKWYVWGGNGIPNKAKQVKKVIHRDGYIAAVQKHPNVNLEGDQVWSHYGTKFDIVAYTLGEPVESKRNKQSVTRHKGENMEKPNTCICGKWISVKDRLPEDTGTGVMESYNVIVDGPYPIVTTLSFSTEGGWVDDLDRKWDEFVKMWMPLPSLPIGA